MKAAIVTSASEQSKFRHTSIGNACHAQYHFFMDLNCCCVHAKHVKTLSNTEVISWKVIIIYRPNNVLQ